MKIAKGSRLLFIGDSVTDVGRERPVAEGLRTDVLGRGYANNVHALLGAVYPERNIHVLNTGISGNTSRDLKARWQTDVLDLKPDWVSVMIGINDVWRFFDCPFQFEKRVELDEYEANLDEIFAMTTPRLAGGLVVMTPFFIEPNLEDPMRKLLIGYQEVCKKLAKKHNALLADTQKHFDRIREFHYAAYIANDRVHPNNIGHMALARAFLDAVEFNFCGDAAGR